MKELVFRCELHSDIVLNASGASEGLLPSHDFIPGSNFLGIVAQKYEEAQKKDLAYDLFHSGKVQFGDAHVLINEKRSHKVPLSWYYQKGCSLEDGVWLSHKTKKVMLKQARTGFFAEINGEYQLADLADVKYYSMKSAYDRERRRAEDEKLFGYTALRSGSTWEFTVCIEDDTDSVYEDFILKNLAGERGVGRSKSAQYGRVKITHLPTTTTTASTQKYQNEIAVYAESRLAFLDEFGQPTMQPKASDLGLPDNSTIVWEKSQIRISRYAPWNGARKAKDADRICIDKGSVFIVNLPDEINLPDKIYGIGIYKNEGFGILMVEPDFLGTNIKDGKIDKTIKKTPIVQHTSISSSSKPDNSFLEWIKQAKATQENDSYILKEVNDFVEKNKNLFEDKFSSQWSSIRAIATKAEDTDSFCNDLFHESNGYLLNGVAAKKWRKNGRVTKLKEVLDKVKQEKPEIVRPFCIKLASEMAKTSSKNKETQQEVN